MKNEIKITKKKKKKRKKEKRSEVFSKRDFKTEITTFLTKVNFLDVTFDLKRNIY